MRTPVFFVIIPCEAVRSKKFNASGDFMTKKLNAVITKENKWYVAHCVELDVVSQGKTLKEAEKNLKEAVELYLESFDTADIPDSKGEMVLYPFEVAVR